MSYNICPVCGEGNGVVNTIIFQCRCAREKMALPAGRLDCSGLSSATHPKYPDAPQSKSDAEHAEEFRKRLFGELPGKPRVKAEDCGGIAIIDYAWRQKVSRWIIICWRNTSLKAN
jgi:hypothetical protein